MANPQHTTLTASTVATITLDSYADTVEILNVDGAAEIYATVDRSTPTVGGDGAWVLPAAVGSLEVKAAPGDLIGVVKLISSGTPKVSVAVIQ